MSMSRVRLHLPEWPSSQALVALGEASRIVCFYSPQNADIAGHTAALVPSSASEY
jgi:hypothetical protein